VDERQTDKEKALALFEDRGIDWVREQVETERFAEFKRRLAVHWLAERDRAARAEAEREASAFAEEAIRRATTANTIAALALIAAIIAIAVTVLDAFVG